MSAPSLWSSGRYEAVAEQIAVIATEVIDAVDHRVRLRGATLVDLACGTGSAALAAAAKGATVTAVDITPELVAIGKSKDADDSVTWLTADASDTGLSGGAYDAAVSNMGIIFVDPVRQVAELSRLLTPGGVIGFSVWSHGSDNPFFDPILEVLGPPPPANHTPDQWADPDTIATRLSDDFEGVQIDARMHAWRFDSTASAVHFVTRESPLHLTAFQRAGELHGRLEAAFETTFAAHGDGHGGVCFDSPYVIVTAKRR